MVLAAVGLVHRLCLLFAFQWLLRSLKARTLLRWEHECNLELDLVIVMIPGACMSLGISTKLTRKVVLRTCLPTGRRMIHRILSSKWRQLEASSHSFFTAASQYWKVRPFERKTGLASATPGRCTPGYDACSVPAFLPQF